MQRNLSTIRHLPPLVWLSMIVLTLLVATGCGPLGDDDGDPTATSESISQPTSAGDADDTASPTSAPSAFVPNRSTPSMSVATPDLPPAGNEEDTQATPDGPGAGGTPVSFDGSGQDSPAGATPVPVGESDSSETAFTGSDGTSGATPGSEELRSSAEEPEAPGGTPDPDDPFFVEETPTPTVVATPPPAGTPVVGEVLELQPFLVTGCDPEVIPLLDAEQIEFVTVIDVNFRAGPGADCDMIGDTPLPANSAVTVLSAPVVPEEDDSFVWVQVQIADEVGWIIVDAIEPAP